MQNNNTIYSNSPGRVTGKFSCLHCNALNFNVLQASPPKYRYKI